jgi:2-polyprenyl-3-methyl-5-hydroxy-6-metoxy-1,4-benzoquinol methylase
VSERATGEATREALIRQRIGARILEVGCAGAETSRLTLDCGADYLLGVDVSEKQLAGALATAIPGRLEYRVADAQEALSDERFEIILGRSILHHLDLRRFLARAAAQNLVPDGVMLWMEPLAHPLTLAFHKLVPRAHTRDER